MNFLREYFFCSPKLLKNVDELDEIEEIIHSIKWSEHFTIQKNNKIYEHQKGYNLAFDIEFEKQNWELQPKLHEEAGFLGDFRKNDIFIEIQFGHSATLFRDYYKFHYGVTNSLFWLAVLIVPTNPAEFFPTRPKSVANMAEYKKASKWFNLLKIPIPILLIGLLPEN